MHGQVHDTVVHDRASNRVTVTFLISYELSVRRDCTRSCSPKFRPCQVVFLFLVQAECKFRLGAGRRYHYSVNKL